MGLDISLYTKAEREQDDRHHAEWNALYERKESGEITEAEYDELREQITPYAPRGSRPSERYPDHLFNRRYLRSSYNDSGFNRAVPDFLGDENVSLYWIFEPVWRADHEALVEVAVVEESSETAIAVREPGTDVVPQSEDEDERGEPGGWVDKRHLAALREARQRALDVAEQLQTCDPLRVEAIHMPMIGTPDHMWSQVPTEEAVLAWYRDELKRHAERDADGAFGEGYSNAKGTVFGFKQGMEVLAVTVGQDVLGHPAPMIVYRSTAIDSYIQSAEITAEFCDEAIELIDRDGSAYVSWSG